LFFGRGLFIRIEDCGFLEFAFAHLNGKKKGAKKLRILPPPWC